MSDNKKKHTLEMPEWALTLRRIGKTLHDEFPPPPALFERFDRERGRRVMIWPQGRLGIIAGPGGSGKSFALMQLAISIITGRPCFRFESSPMVDENYITVGDGVSGRKVIYVLAEDSQNLALNRLKKVCERLGLSEHESDAILDSFIWVDSSKKDTRLIVPGSYGTPEMASFFPELVALIKSVNPALVILDPLAKMAPDAEATNAMASLLMHHASALTSETTSVVFVHHTRKSSIGEPLGSESIRGASGLVDGARFAATMWRNPPTGNDKRNTVSFMLPAKSSDVPSGEWGLVLEKDDEGRLSSIGTIDKTQIAETAVDDAYDELRRSQAAEHRSRAALFDELTAKLRGGHVDGIEECARVIASVDAITGKRKTAKKAKQSEKKKKESAQSADVDLHALLR